MKEHYYWWDLEASKFKGILYDSIGTYFLFEHSYTNWDEFVEADPHMAYAYLTYIRFNALEQQFVDLRVIPQMLGVKQVPIQSVVQDINRYEWLKSIIDLTLFRFSSLRDISFHFVNEVLELQISDHSLNVKQISKALRRSNSQLIKNLKVLEKAGLPLRHERNQRAHKGFCDLHTDDDEIFKSMAWAELHNFKSDKYDLVSTYESSKEKIHGIVVQEVSEALKASVDLVDESYVYYRDRYTSLASSAKTGVGQHFYLHCENE